LIVSRDEAEPASRMPVRGGGAGCGGWAGGTAAGFLRGGAFALGAVAREPLALGAGARELTLGGRFGLGAGFFALTLARGAWDRALTGFFDGFLEELTPELPDPAHRIGKALQGHHRGPSSEVLAWRRG
jgi:hypothetical protein